MDAITEPCTPEHRRIPFNILCFVGLCPIFNMVYNLHEMWGFLVKSGFEFQLISRLRSETMSVVFWPTTKFRKTEG